MKFVHLADLHIGKRLRERSLMEDQRFALDFILERVRQIGPDVALIAGDVYDRAVPTGDAVLMLDGFLTALTALCRVIIVGGNHDSQDRLAFGRALLQGSGLFISDAYRGEMRRVAVPDEFGEVDVWLLPHIVPAEVARYFEGEIQGVDGAVRAAIGRAGIDFSRRNVLLTHQFVTARGETPELSDSEIHPVGGLDAVDAGAFDGFCYVALGHLHGAQRVGRDSVRYAGSPVRYSFSEARQRKRFVSGEIGADGGVSIELIEIPQLHGMREMEGPLEMLVAPENVAQGDAQDYIRAVLTDVPPPIAAMDRLRAVFPNVLSLGFSGSGGAVDADLDAAGMDESDPLDLFGAFYLQVTGRALGSDGAAEVAEALNALRSEQREEVRS